MHQEQVPSPDHSTGESPVRPAPPAIGSTESLSLRVSAACLTRFIIQSRDADPLVLFERIVRVDPAGGFRLSLQPIGGGVHIEDPSRLSKIVGNYTFESTEAWAEGDLRIFINPNRWEILRDALKSDLARGSNLLVETSPLREIQEEIGDFLGLTITSDDITIRRVAAEVQDTPRLSARTGEMTVRVFSIDEITVTNPALAQAILSFCTDTSLDAEKEFALKSTKGKCSSLALVPLHEIIAKTKANDRLVQEMTLADNVYAIVKDLV